MKIVAALLLTAAIGLGLATASFADCAGHKTAAIKAPSTPVTTTTKTG